MRTIRASAGDTEYVSATVTENSGADITGDTFKVSLGSYASPNGWRDPAPIENVSSSSVRLKLLVGAQGDVVPTPGVYWLWVQVGDTPETEAFRVDQTADGGDARIVIA